MEYRGIDVSKWQGDIDYKKVKNTGIEFIIARIGYGMYENQKDKKFEDNYNGAINNNIPIGVYLYSYALDENDASKEADVVLKWLKNRKLNLPVYYDIEDKSQRTISKSTLTKMCEVVEKKYTIWVAQYNNKNTYNGKYDMWRYTSKGKINGINGNVDMNILYKDIFTNLNKPKENYYPIPNYKGTSIVDALKKINVNSSFENRKKIAIKNGITDYKGTSKQNTKLLNLLKQGKLKK